MADDPKLPVVMRPVLPNVLRLRSPEDVELEMRLLSATRLDAPEAIAEVQRIAAELAGMISVAEAADAVIAEAQSVNAALLRARKAAKRAKRLAAKAADDPERRVRAVDVACHMAGREPAKTDVCVDDIRPHLPKEDHHATVRELKEVSAKSKSGGHPPS